MHTHIASQDFSGLWAEHTVFAQRDLWQARLDAITGDDVQRVLQDAPGIYRPERLCTLIAPAAQDYLEDMQGFSYSGTPVIRLNQRTVYSLDYVNNPRMSDLLVNADDFEEVRPQVFGLLRATFKPEFLNRIDDIIPFSRLDRSQVAAIVKLQLDRLQDRLKGRKIMLTFSDAALKAIAAQGYDPAFGARPVKRAVQELVQNALARKILDGSVSDGDTVEIDYAGGGEGSGTSLTFTVR